jgi:hypothetical protein
MWTKETLGRGNGGGSELLLKMDHDGDTRMAKPRDSATAVEGATAHVGLGNPRQVGWWGLNRGGSGAARLGRFGAVWLGVVYIYIYIYQNNLIVLKYIIN